MKQGRKGQSAHRAAIFCFPGYYICKTPLVVNMNADLNIYSRAAPGVILVNLGTLGARGPGQGLLHAHINAN